MRKNSSEIREGDKADELAGSQEVVVFLGQLMTPAEYEACCRNLSEFFDLLQSWQEEESHEPT